MITCFIILSVLSILKIDENNLELCILLLNIVIISELIIEIIEIKSIYNQYCNEYIIEREWIGDIIDGIACNGHGMKRR